ncbi:MBL fold metallo-hydrolase [Nitrolancea hollandica]|nr:MBL fold metallo-hydrolase [Nitrolancea hollandica]
MTASPSMTVAELRDALDRHDPVTIIDVRPADQYAEWSIPGSQHIDAYKRLTAGDRHALDTVEVAAKRPVITVCAAGRVSMFAAGLLRERGIEAISLAGGMKAWSLAWNTAEIELPGATSRVIQVRRTGKGCLSYIIGSDGRAVVIDASLDPGVYLTIAEQHGWKIAMVVDTHIHADHLSRSRMLAERTGATLRLPGQDRVHYPFQPLHDGERLSVGAATLQALSVPGHTNESMAYLLDKRVLFSGDTLFLSSVGRPDLEATANEARERATALYHSLQRLLALPPDTKVLPGHVSEPIPFDGRLLTTTLGAARERIDLLRVDEVAFVTNILRRIPPTPPNHHLIVQANEAGVFPDGDVTDLEAGANRCAVL